MLIRPLKNWIISAFSKEKYICYNSFILKVELKHPMITQLVGVLVKSTIYSFYMSFYNLLFPWNFLQCYNWIYLRVKILHIQQQLVFFCRLKWSWQNFRKKVFSAFVLCVLHMCYLYFMKAHKFERISLNC